MLLSPWTKTNKTFRIYSPVSKDHHCFLSFRHSLFTFSTYELQRSYLYIKMKTKSKTEDGLHLGPVFVNTVMNWINCEVALCSGWRTKAEGDGWESERNWSWFQPKSIDPPFARAAGAFCVFLCSDISPSRPSARDWTDKEALYTTDYTHTWLRLILANTPPSSVCTNSAHRTGLGSRTTRTLALGTGGRSTQFSYFSKSADTDCKSIRLEANPSKSTKVLSFCCAL